jgi:hypothetical protein
MGDLMRKRLLIVRVVLLLVAGALGAVGVEARRFGEPGGEPTRPVTGVTGQRQAIELEVDEDGRPRAFHTMLYLNCSDGDEWDITWSRGDAGPVPFERRGDRLHVRETSSRDYGEGVAGRGSATMHAHATGRGMEGWMRAVWRFTRRGREYLVCDSGSLPFAMGPRASRRLERVRRSAEPWSLYPADAEPAAPRSWPHARFVARVDRACMRTSRARPANQGFARYVRWHAQQWAALAGLGIPPAKRPAHARWLRNFRRRVLLEGIQLDAQRRGDLDAAARLSAQVATLKAEGNVDGLRFGLSACTSNGPTGAPKS